MRMLFLLLAPRSGAQVGGSGLLQRLEPARGVAPGLSGRRDHVVVLERWGESTYSCAQLQA